MISDETQVIETRRKGAAVLNISLIKKRKKKFATCEERAQRVLFEADRRIPLGSS